MIRRLIESKAAPEYRYAMSEILKNVLIDRIIFNK